MSNLNINKPVRIFKLGGIVLQDIDSEMTPEQIVAAYAVNYPNLKHATLSEPVLTGNELVYVIENTTAVKTKG